MASCKKSCFRLPVLGEASYCFFSYVISPSTARYAVAVLVLLRSEAFSLLRLDGAVNGCMLIIGVTRSIDLEVKEAP